MFALSRTGCHLDTHVLIFVPGVLEKNPFVFQMRSVAARLWHLFGVRRPVDALAKAVPRHRTPTD